MFRLASWLIVPALLLIVLLRLQGRQSSVGQSATATTTNIGKANITISEHNRRHDNISEGITYSRTILEFPDNGRFELNFEDSRNHCSLRDVYGDNHCHFNWGEKVTGRVTVQLNDPIVEGDYMEGALVIDKFIPYQFRCALCGEDCVLSFPVIHHNETIRMPPCPVSVHATNEKIVYQMMDDDPTRGRWTTKIEGTIQFTQAASWKTLALIRVEGYVK